MLYIDMFNINMMYSNKAERNSALGDLKFDGCRSIFFFSKSKEAATK